MRFNHLFISIERLSLLRSKSTKCIYLPDGMPYYEANNGTVPYNGFGKSILPKDISHQIMCEAT